MYLINERGQVHNGDGCPNKNNKYCTSEKDLLNQVRILLFPTLFIKDIYGDVWLLLNFYDML